MQWNWLPTSMGIAVWTVCTSIAETMALSLVAVNPSDSSPSRTTTSRVTA